MAIGVISIGVGVTQAQYKQVHHQVMPNDEPPAGLAAHVAGPSANGWCVVELWESQDALDRFFQERLGQALQDAGITMQSTIFDVANSFSR